MIKKGVADKQPDCCFNLDFLLASIFVKAFSVWELHKGVVPAEILSELDHAGDWPRGTAAAAMNRLNRDVQLRNQLRKRCQ